MKLLKLLAATSAAAVLLASPVLAQDQTRIALVVKSLGNGFFDAAAKGAEEAAAELGNVELIYTGPTAATAEAQIEVVNSLIAQQVDAIAISANDPDALVPVLQRAMQRGIKVLSWDSAVAPEGRQLHLNPSDPNLIGDHHQAGCRPPARGRRRRHSVGRVHRDQPERLDRSRQGRHS